MEDFVETNICNTSIARATGFISPHAGCTSYDVKDNKVVGTRGIMTRFSFTRGEGLSSSQSPTKKGETKSKTAD